MTYLMSFLTTIFLSSSFAAISPDVKKPNDKKATVMADESILNCY